LEQFLQMLTRSGFSPADTLHIYRVYFDFLYGHICSERLEQVHDDEEAQDPHSTLAATACPLVRQPQDSPRRTR